MDLAAYFSNLGVGKVENVVLCRNWSKLQEAVIKRAEFLLKLETVYVQCQQKPRHFPTRRTNAQYNRGDYLFNRQDRHERIPFLQPRGIAHSDTIPDEIVLLLDSVDAACRPTHNTGFMGCFGERVDSALHYAAEFRKWDYLVAKYRSSPESSSPTAVGIITFESPESANLVSQVVVHRRPFANMLTMAPEPRDIYWANLSSPIASNHTKLARGLFVVISTFLLVSFSTVIVTTIAGLIDLEQLAILFPILGAILHDLPETQIQFVQGVIPVLLLAAWNSSLPSVLLSLLLLI